MAATNRPRTTSNDDFQFVLDALLKAYKPILEKELKQTESAKALLQSSEKNPPTCDDEIELAEGGIRRRTNRAGGIEGGMSTGEVLRVRAAMKPISTVPRALATVDVRTGEPARAINQRSDVTAVPAAGVVAEAMVAFLRPGAGPR